MKSALLIAALISIGSHGLCQPSASLQPSMGEKKDVINLTDFDLPKGSYLLRQKLMAPGENYIERNKQEILLKKSDTSKKLLSDKIYNKQIPDLRSLAYPQIKPSQIPKNISDPNDPVKMVGENSTLTSDVRNFLIATTSLNVKINKQSQDAPIFRVDQPQNHEASKIQSELELAQSRISELEKDIALLKARVNRLENN